MDTSLFLAKFWGWYLIVFFLILSFRPNRIRQILSYVKDEKFLLLSAFIAIIIGLTNIILHNIWELNYKLIITGIGWLSLSKGLVFFIFPKVATKWLDSVNIKLIQILYLLLLFIGLYILNIAYEIVLF